MTEQEELNMYLDEMMIQELREEKRREEELAQIEYLEEMKKGFELLSTDMENHIYDITENYEY
jgi:hypothetical protein